LREIGHYDPVPRGKQEGQMAAKPKDDQPRTIDILPITQGLTTFCLLGTTPMFFNRMSEKAKRDILLGSRRKSKAEQAENLKHDPIREYRDSVYKHFGDRFPTRLKFPSEGFKKCVAAAALDIPGAYKTEVGRLTSFPPEQPNVSIYGIPKLSMDVVRSADIKHTPDIRTRAVIERWCCKVTLSFVQPKLNERTVGYLMSAAGILIGIGDWRQEKGSSNKGSFEVVLPDDAAFKAIVAEGGRKAQDAALLNPVCLNEETQELLDWYHEEVLRRGRDKDAPKPSRKKPGERRVLS
jgi:hypothetical protein